MLYEVITQLLANELANVSAEFKSLLTSIDRRLRQVIDMAVAIKSNTNNLDKLIKDQKQLIKQGQNEERLFTIKDGEVIIARQIENSFVPLARLKKGDFFGRVPFRNNFV